MSENEIKVYIETVPNPDCIIVHVNYEISNAVIENFMRPLRDSSERYLDKIGPLGTKIVRELFSLQGIAEVTIQPYQLHIQKGKLFDWVKLKPAIKRILNKQGLPYVEFEETLWQHFVRVIKIRWETIIKKIKMLIARILSKVHLPYHNQ